MASCLDTRERRKLPQRDPLGKFEDYLCRTVGLLLEDSDDTPEAFAAAFRTTDTMVMRGFLGDPGVPVLVVQRLSIKGQPDNSFLYL